MLSAAMWRSCMAMVVILPALHIGVYHFATLGTFRPLAVGAVLLGCTNLDQQLARPLCLSDTTTVCFDAQFVSPHAGPFRGTAKTASAAREITRKIFQGGKHFHCLTQRSSTTYCARARFESELLISSPPVPHPLTLTRSPTPPYLHPP